MLYDPWLCAEDYFRSSLLQTFLDLPPPQLPWISQRCSVFADGKLSKQTLPPPSQPSRATGYYGQLRRLLLIEGSRPPLELGTPSRDKHWWSGAHSWVGRVCGFEHSFDSTLTLSASFNVKGHLRRKTNSCNGSVHVKGIWKFLSNLNFAKCRWKREKERKEFLTWCNICIQHSINCARVQTSLFWIKDGASLAMVRYFL